jgi:hypothetical protein
MSWQARVRKLFKAGGYNRVVVLGGEGKAAFYDGMPLDYRVVDLTHVPGTAFEDRRHEKAPVPAEQIRQCLAGLVEQARAEYRSAGAQVDVLWPEYSGKPYSCDPACQDFIRYSRPAERIPGEPWVVMVQRNRAHDSTKNWPAEHWDELRRLLAERGVRTTIYPCEAQAAMAMLCGCDLAVGQSTGGLHLAALCGCPTLIWSVQRYLMWRWEITNRQRYETWWNPLGSPVIAHDAPQLPTPQVAAEQVMWALSAIGRRSGSRLKCAVFRGKWKLRNALRRSIIEPRRYANWPWPVQRFVRYRIA